MYGILHYEAARISSAIMLAYGLAGWLNGFNSGQRNFDFAVIAFASFMGFVIHYGFARAVRHNWFTHQVLSDSANRDSLTGIANRRMFDDHIDRMWNQAVRMHVPVALLLVDLDQFKAFNDHHGHQAGDACLARVANAIARAARRPLDLAARYGGEEFVVLLYDIRRERVEELCREVHANIAALEILHAGSSVNAFVTVSIGAACIEPVLGRRHEGLVQLADEALYAAKERGRNRTVVMDHEYEGLETGAFRTPRARNRAAA
jgi:diguanylate cyclase (GGDEF)-like protein